jgi:hypothetical protein
VIQQPPSERELASIERELTKLPRGAQRAVGGGIYMRLDAAGRRRYQYRACTGSGRPAGTHESWELAAQALGRIAEGAYVKANVTISANGLITQLEFP